MLGMLCSICILPFSQTQWLITQFTTMQQEYCCYNQQNTVKRDYKISEQYTKTA